jgi:cystathionine gamma-synthase
VAALEGAAHGLAFASGMAAVDTVVRQLGPGDHVLVNADGYGGTHRLLRQVHDAHFSAVDLGDLGAVAAAWTDRTRLVWAESPTNPGLQVVDIAALAALARERGALCAVDNTFATPYLQRPLALGADVVVHSTSKYLGGHSDVIGGFVATDDADLAAALTLTRNAAGSVPGPFDCFLVLRGVKTLALRMDRHCDNALAVAGFLHGHPAVASVSYPGLGGHAGHELARRQMSGRFGGMVSCVLAGGEAAAAAMVGRTRLFTLGESLGGVESLIGYPARMSHASLAGTPLAADPALVRLSVGIEDIDDLLADLAQALA